MPSQGRKRDATHTCSRLGALSLSRGVESDNWPVHVSSRLQVTGPSLQSVKHFLKGTWKTLSRLALACEQGSQASTTAGPRASAA